MNWRRLAHSFAGLCILAAVGALAAISFAPDSFMGLLSKAVVVAQAFIVLGAINLYIMVKTPFRDVISENADALVDGEQLWREGKLVQPGATFLMAAAIEATGRVIAIMFFAGASLAVISLGVLVL